MCASGISEWSGRPQPTKNGEAERKRQFRPREAALSISPPSLFPLAAKGQKRRHGYVSLNSSGGSRFTLAGCSGSLARFFGLGLGLGLGGGWALALAADLWGAIRSG